MSTKRCQWSDLAITAPGERLGGLKLTGVLIECPGCDQIIGSFKGVNGSLCILPHFFDDSRSPKAQQLMPVSRRARRRSERESRELYSP
jgi:hypothetical protein